MYRGVGVEKHLMKDPATANARIYVGNVVENISKEDFESHFQKYGTIVGTLLNRGFGFIQFENEMGAAEAIKNEHQNQPFHGRKLVVRHVFESTGKPNRGGRGGGSDGISNRGGRGGIDMGQSRPGIVGGEAGRNDIPGRDNFNRGGAIGPNRGGPMIDNSIRGNRRGGRGRGGGNGGNNGNQGVNNDRDRSPLNMNDRGPNEWRDNTGGGSFGFNNSNEKQMPFCEQSYSTSNNTFMPPMNNFPKAQERPPGAAASAESNDCEIIVVSKALTEYAEYIEDRLKRIGLSVDLLFPNEDVPIGRVLGNISSRGCLYAILVMPQNEEHRSLTLNILHGLPQEHRNMPVDDAISLIDRNFKSYMRGDKGTVPNAVPILPAKTTMASLQQKHPETIQSLVNLLADNRPLTVLQYDKIIRYLQERRELQVKLELGEGSEMETAAAPNKTQQELQNRILSILNKTSGGSPTSTVPDVVSVPAPQVQPTSTTSTPLLNDPTVQKALDSLLQGNLLQNLSGNSRF